MSDKKKIERQGRLMDKIDRGGRAQIALEEIDAAVNDLRDRCFKTFCKSDFNDDEGRRNTRIYMQILEDVENRFQQAVRTGEIARKELITINEPNVRDIKNA